MFEKARNKDLSSFVTTVNNIVASVTEINKVVTSKYVNLKTLLNENGVDLGLENVDVDLTILKEEQEAPHVPILQEFGALLSASPSSDGNYFSFETEFSILNQSGNRYAYSLRAPIRKDGTYSTLLNSDMFPTNTTMRHDDQYYMMFPGGLTSLTIACYRVDGSNLSATYLMSGTSNYTNDFLKFVDFMSEISMQFEYTLQQGNSRVMIVSRSNQVMIDDIVTVAPDIRAAYEIGLAASTVNKSGKGFIN